MNNQTDNVRHAIGIIERGPRALATLEALLEEMTLEERCALCTEVIKRGLPAPRIVHFDYKIQRWYLDIQ